ncbi:MAG: 4'-phosphopantetheinyl transferase superfamily protein [Betaproteobacteria bacterium]
MIGCADPKILSWMHADPLRYPLVISVSTGGALPDPIHLSIEEITRANAMAHTGSKNRFLLQHHLLRNFLSHWLTVQPSDLGFVQNHYGKPALADSDLHFSISRSGQSLAFYFGPVAGGIDIEELRSSQPFQAIIESHFHPNEQAAARSDKGFFTLWTRKEALLKAVGTGLTDTLSAFDCTPEHVAHRGQKYTLSTYVSPYQVISLALSGNDQTTPLCFNL